MSNEVVILDYDRKVLSMAKKECGEFGEFLGRTVKFKDYEFGIILMDDGSQLFKLLVIDTYTGVVVLDFPEELVEFAVREVERLKLDSRVGIFEVISEMLPVMLNDGVLELVDEKRNDGEDYSNVPEPYMQSEDQWIRWAGRRQLEREAEMEEEREDENNG